LLATLKVKVQAVINLAIHKVEEVAFSGTFQPQQHPLKISGVELAAVCDLYQGRLVNAKEEFGESLFTTINYKDLLDRKDIDAVLICTTDVWHARIAMDALAKGKHVYCEKPMVYKIDEGYPVMDAAKKSGKVFQVGSQRVSSIGYLKAKELLAAGEIGKLNIFGQRSVRPTKFHRRLGIHDPQRRKCPNDQLG